MRALRYKALSVALLLGAVACGVLQAQTGDFGHARNTGGDVDAPALPASASSPTTDAGLDTLAGEPPPTEDAVRHWQGEPGPVADDWRQDDRQLSDDVTPTVAPRDDDRVQTDRVGDSPDFDDRRQDDLFGGAQEAGERTTGTTQTAEAGARAAGRRFAVVPRIAPLLIQGQARGRLYRWSVIVTPDTSSSPESLPVSGLVSGYLAPDQGTTFATGDVAEGTFREDALFTNERLRVRGKLKAGTSVTCNGLGPSVEYSNQFLLPVLPLQATVPRDALVEIGRHDAEPPNRRYESMEIPIYFIEASGTEEAPQFGEILPDDPSLGTLRQLDYESGLADEMAHFGKLRPGQPLYIFLISDPAAHVAHMHDLLPIKDRASGMYRQFQVDLMDGTSVHLQEPYPVIVFPKHIAAGQGYDQIASGMKHELGHVLQFLQAPIYNKGYKQSFGAHNVSVRTNDAAAFVEGFAEYTEVRFRDSDRENSPARFDGVTMRRNQSAYTDLLFFYWQKFRGSSALSSRVPAEAWEKAETSLFAFLTKKKPAPPFARFQSQIIQQLKGKGAPPVEEREVRAELATLDADNAEALANLNDEYLSKRDKREMKAAMKRLSGELRKSSRGRPANVAQALQGASQKVLRSPTDMMMNEGTVATVLLALDKQLGEQNIDFYQKVLDALKQDPYPGGSDPPQPLNIKELIAVLDRDPELHGKVFPIVTQATQGVLREEHFALAPTRDEDPLTRALPGVRPTLAARPRTTSPGDSVGGTVPVSGPDDLFGGDTGDIRSLPSGRGDSSAALLPSTGTDDLGPADPGEAAGPRTVSPEPDPGFDDLRAK